MIELVSNPFKYLLACNIFTKKGKNISLNKTNGIDKNVKGAEARMTRV